MGKAQSKRSVDITTENKDGAVDTEAGKVGKIEDVEKPQLNGDVKEAETSVSTPTHSITFSVLPKLDHIKFIRIHSN